MPRPIIGAHVSAAGGPIKAIENALRIGAEAIQMFGASPRQWAVSLPSPETVRAFKEANKKAKLPLFLHAPYLINLASPEAALRNRSGRLLADHLRIAEELGARGLIFHIGSGKESTREKALAMTAAAIKAVLRAAPGKSSLIIENSAGGGEKIGRNLEEIAGIIEVVASPRVGVCFDTAHAFEAGIVPNYSLEAVAKLAKEVERTVGWSRLLAIHANDSRTTWNSHHDRHENIGKGYIGLDGFRVLLNDRKFSKVPFLLEVPGFDNEGPDKKNIDILRRLAGR